MGNNQAWIQLDECVNAYLDESEQSIHKYYKIWQIAFRVMTELGIDFFYQIRTEKIEVAPNFTAQLPPDCLNWTKIGVLNDVGEIIPLKYNDKLTNYAQFSPDRLTKTQDNTLFNFFLFNTPIWYNFWTGNMFTILYGMPSGAPFVGNFKVDKATGTILLDETFSYSYLMVEYLASPQQGQTYYVPLQFKEALIAGMAWMDIRNIPIKTHVQNSSVAMRRKEFYNQRRLAWARYRPLNLMDAYEWWLSTQRLTVKT